MILIDYQCLKSTTEKEGEKHTEREREREREMMMMMVYCLLGYSL